MENKENSLHVELETRTGIMKILGKTYVFRMDKQDFYFEGLTATDFIDTLETLEEKNIFIEIFDKIGQSLY